ncbi:MAG: NADH-quinone oxidoreductase subunit NuoH [Caldilineaceae bacterium]|nr:NADH-quinone oxidoreductase subunit NuoH [Caldilineaceae bacterium]MCB0087983.1 NADH-quinone oxidoreductase subunit NuoH [Caldilineaceae bacterium]MCB9148749.1 NADH-quinone oxidoreductase subunit NuoH [Caldilineaceae bacterium]MCB9156816.1 NADH-quinone oxidoreductase subunit NuoH [Caldilineaceae bacterium]
MDWLNLVILPAIRVIIMIFVLLTGAAYLTWYERKLISRFQIRYGPNRAGIYGLLQPAADGIKAIFKEEIIPNHVDKVIYLMGPALALIPAIVIWAVIPIAKETPAIADVNIGFLWILAIAGVESYGLILAGWSSNNNYSLLGALRSSAQMISYELPMGVFLASVLMLAGSFSLVELVQNPRPWWEWIWLWAMFPFFFICILAETNRAPFDLPETENELVAGYQTEYGGMKFSLFMIAEYINMITTSTIMATIFFGGWKLPFGILQNVVILGPFVLLAKVLVLLFLFVWVRASIGRPRYDQLMSFTWKFLLPLSLVYMFITALLTIQFK